MTEAVFLCLAIFAMTLCTYGQNVEVFLPLSSSSPGTLVGDLDILTDPELKQAQNAPYVLEETGHSNNFVLNSNLLNLLVVPQSESVYTISISHLSGTLSLAVSFTTNPNPHIPTITPDVAYLSVSESTQIGDTVYNFTCTNSALDLSHTLNVEFYLEDMIGLFNISGGELRVSRELSALDTPFVPLLINCIDPHAPYFEADAAVIINITHANPTLLTCDTPLTIYTCEQENDVILSDIKCYHPVYLYSSELSYVISDSKFKEENGQIMVASSLDYEDITQVDFQITVSDPLNTSLSAIIDVTVFLLPVNEFTPVLTETVYHVSENQLPPQTTSLLASDLDRGLHGEFIFLFDPADNNNPFTLSEDGVLTVTSILDHESKSDYMIDVTLTDKIDPAGTTCGVEQISNTETIQIVVVDVNERASFVSNLYSFQVFESGATGTFLGSIACSDPDNNFVPNGQITYSSGSSLISIGSSSGSVTLAQSLDFFLSSNSTVSARCQDGGVPPLSDTTQVTIIVNPVISFEQVTYTVDLPDNSGVGAFIATVSLSDQIRIFSVIFSLSADPSNGVVVIDSETGVLTLNKEIPINVPNNRYTLIVHANAEVKSNDGAARAAVTTAQLIISIVNDTDLYFPFQYSTNVSENVRDISLLTITAINLVTDKSDGILYSLPELSSDFELNNITGELLLTSPLDRELQSVYTLVVVAYDMFNVSIRARTSVLVTVLDVNDVTPMCVSLTERVITGHYFAVPQVLTPSINCSDLDAEPPNNNVTYSLLDYSFSNLSMDSDNGMIYGMGSLTLGFHDLTVLVSDRGVEPGPLNTTEVVRIHVTRNDHTPQFINVSSSIDLFENDTLLSPITTIHVSDADTGPPADILISYRVISPNNDDVFVINASTGVLSLAESLDYERTREYILEVNATDNGRPRRHNTTLLTIRVVNLNDESPDCGELAFLQLDFDNHFPDFLYQLSCFDPDNFTDLLFYSLDNTSNTSSYFSVSNTGTIETISSFLPLSSPVFPVHLSVPIIVAENASSLTSLIHLNLLLGESGFSLEFQPSPPVTIQENSQPGTLVTTFVAIDTPTQTDLTISYSIRSVTPDSDMLHLNSTTGQLTLTQLIDYEAVPEYNLSIRAVDDAIYVNIRILYVNIQVIDVCDNPPVIDHTQSNITIPQGTHTNAISDVIHTFPCYDRDDGKNGEIFCSVDSIEPLVDDGEDLFVMSGCDLRLNRPLNGICILEYSLRISCSDLCDDVSLRTNLSFEFQVGVVFENLERPHVREPSPYPARRNVFENQTVPLELDLTENHFIDEDCAPFNQTFFTIFFVPTDYLISDKEEGRIILNRTVDFDEDSVLIARSHRISSVIAVFDCEDLSPSCQGVEPNLVYTVHIIDVNDNKPECVSTSTQLTIPETDVPGTEHATSVICSDVDRTNDTTGMIYYEIGSSASLAATIFEVFGTPHSPVNNLRRLNVRLLAPLDYENTTQYVLHIRVHDGGTPPLYSNENITLTINVASVNEHLPFFESELVLLSLSEDFDISNVIHTSAVIDLDHAPDDRALYQLFFNPDNKFFINSTTGNITLTSSLDREMNDSYKLVVLATEDTTQSHNHTATQTIQITINDVNDNSPQLDLPLTPIQIQQNVTIGEIHTFDCVDFDIGDNGIFTCDITSPVFNTVTLFSLSVVSPVCSLLIESTPVPSCSVPLTHNLDINCTDSGYPSLSSSFTISVVVNLVNLQDPVLSNSLTPIPLSESTLVPSPLLDLSEFVTDGDCQSFGLVKYSINNQYPNLAFLSLSQLGEVELIKQVDFESPVFGYPPSLHLEVIARDSLGAVSGREIRFNVSFLIQDVNDNPPTCSVLSLTISLQEGSLSPLNLSTLCFDLDSNLNGDLSSIFTSDHLSIFRFSRFPYNFTHSLITIRPLLALDFETTESYSISVSVSDRGTPQLDTSLSVTVNVVNINDNTPFFTNPPVSLTVIENDPPTTLYVISADDDDKEEFGQLVYLLITVNYNLLTNIDVFIGNTSQFEIGLYSGELVQLTEINYEEDTIFTFGVLVQDTSRSVKAYFNITIENVNEFAPVIAFPSPGAVLQGAAVNTVVGFAHVSDQDRDDTFSCTILSNSTPSPIASNLFSLNNTANRVYVLLSQSVICNDQLLYQLSIECSDDVANPLSSLAVYNISIAPQNLNIPLPTTHTISLVIDENEALNTVITSIFPLLADSDCAQNGSYRYSIILQDPVNHGLLAIDSLSGVVSINETLDYESLLFMFIIPRVEIWIQVHDDLLGVGPTPLSSPIILTVMITDLNDNPPVCTPNDVISIPEEMEAVLSSNIVCTDRDSFTDITAELVQTNLNTKFRVEMVQTMDTTYRLILNISKLDFEQTETYNISVFISDPTNQAFNQTVNLFIQVLSVNEGAPLLFPGTLTVQEDHPVNTSIGAVFVYNQDRNESWVFSIINQTYPFPVELDRYTGTLTLNTSLDYEIPAHRSISIQIVVTDTGVPPMSSTTIYIINLEDVNDNPVEIALINNQSYFEILQSQDNGTIAILSCTDPDSYPNNLFQCSLNTSGSYAGVFYVSVVGDVCQIIPLRSPPCIDSLVYDLTVNCMNLFGVTLNSSFDIQVHLIPENLVAPEAPGEVVFPLFIGSVSELDTVNNLPIVLSDTSNISLLFIDTDCGTFGQLIFLVDTNLSKNAEYVYVNNRTGEVSIIREIDKEVLKSQTGGGRINIFIDVLDNNGQPGFKEYQVVPSPVIIDIQDDNDEPPECDTTNLTLVLDEEILNPVIIPGSSFICMDRDNCEGGLLSVGVDAYSPYLVAFTGTPACIDVVDVYEPLEIEILSNTLDLEVIQQTVIQFNIVVSDNVHTTLIPVTLTILDKPEYPLVFTQDLYNLTLNSSAPVGLVAFSVVATDDDFTSEIRYSSNNQFLSVDAVNGSIYIEPAFLSIQLTTFQLTITATELTTSDTTTAILNISINYPPVLSKPNITEYCVNDSTVFLTLGYHDNNANTTAQDEVMFYFQDPSNPPLINSTNSTTIEFAVLDADAFSTTLPTEYTLTVEDSTGLTDTFSFSVTKCSNRTRRQSGDLTRHKRGVIKTLHFSELTKLVYVPLSLPPGTILPIQSCQSPLSLPTTYSLLLANHTDWPFAIEAVSAEIQLSDSLYRLTYQLVIQCANPLHDDKSSYVVIVLRESEYLPQFNETVYSFSVAESFPVHTSVGVVVADTPRMHTMSFNVTHGLFDVKMYSGEIFFNSPLDFETEQSYSFIVTATNIDIYFLDPPPSSTASVVITVTDVNDNAPVSVGDHTLIIYTSDQEEVLRQVFLQVHCTDADLPETNQIEYSLETPHLIFDITPDDGYVYLSSNPLLLTKDYQNIFITRCTDQTHIPSPVFDRSVITVSVRPHSSLTCPQLSDFNLTWPQTEPNTTTRVLCPETLKAASRVCSSTGQWQLPDLSQCNTLHNVRGVIPVVIPDKDCFDSFLASYLSHFLLIRDNLADTSTDKLHLAGDLRLSVEYFIATDGLLTCLPLNTTSLHSVALNMLEGLDLLTQPYFYNAWVTLGPVYQSIVSTQLVYILNSLMHKLVYFRAIDSQSTQYNFHQYIATELHPNQASTINSPYLFVNTKITFTSCYLQGVPDEMGLSYLNDSVIYILHYLPPHVSAEGVVRRGVSTSYVGVYSSGYTDNGPACYFNITFTTKQGTEDYLCAVWEFNTLNQGYWNPEICYTSVREEDVICSCRGVGVVGVIGTTPPIIYPNCFPLPNLNAFILFILSFLIISTSIIISMVLLIVTSTKVFKKPTLYFKIHTLSFLLLAEIVNFIGIFLIPYDNACLVIAVVTHILFVFVFCWILTLSFFNLSTFLFPKKEKLLNKYSLIIFFTGYAIPLCLAVVSLVEYPVFGILAPLNTSQCKYLYCWISSSYDFPTFQLITSALPLTLTQIVLAVPLFSHFFIPESEPKTSKQKPPLVNTRLSLSHALSETLCGYIQVYLIGFHYAFLSNAYETITFALLSFLFALLTSAFLLSYYTGLVAALAKSDQKQILKPKHSVPDFVSAEDYETRLVMRQHERVNWAFLNAQEERFYEEGRQLGTHFKIATPHLDSSLDDLKKDLI